MPKEPKSQHPKPEPESHKPIVKKQPPIMHGILACGFDEIEFGWSLECVCGFCTPTLPLMEMVGECYDNHLRLEGILRDGSEV